MVSAHFERLFASHNKTNLLRLFVLQQSRITRPALLPFVSFRTEPEELCAPGGKARGRKVIKGVPEK
jgi:hypothetical protein